MRQRRHPGHSAINSMEQLRYSCTCTGGGWHSSTDRREYHSCWQHSVAAGLHSMHRQLLSGSRTAAISALHCAFVEVDWRSAPIWLTSFANFKLAGESQATQVQPEPSWLSHNVAGLQHALAE
jgi:hypothetical protein